MSFSYAGRRAACGASKIQCCKIILTGRLQIVLQARSLDHVNITPPILELSEKEKKKLKKKISVVRFGRLSFFSFALRPKWIFRFFAGLKFFPRRFRRHVYLRDQSIVTNTLSDAWHTRELKHTRVLFNERERPFSGALARNAALHHW